MDLHVVAYIMARLIYALAIVLIFPFFTAVCWHEPFLSFALATLSCMIIGSILDRYGKIRTDKLTLREGMAVTGLTWFVASIIAAIPFLVDTNMGTLDCLFEAVSGITGSGGSVIPDLNALSRSLILWRSLTHWLGGLGIVVIFIALFPQPGSGVMHMFFAESSANRVMPRIKVMADALLAIYIGLTLLLTLLLFLCGIDPFTAFNNAMSAVGTGGFSTENGSIADFNNLPAEIIITIFMLIGGGNFALYYVTWHKGISCLWRNTEFKIYIGLFIVISFFIGLNLVTALNYTPAEALRYATFETAATMTSTGFTIVDFEDWPTFSRLAILTLMLIGGCAGSTAGGIKVIRIVILFKMVRTVIQQKLHPHSVIHVKIDGREQSQTAVLRVGRFFFLYIMFCLLTASIMAVDGVPIIDAIGMGISCMGNAGVAFGTLAESFEPLPNFSKLICCFFMILGRLEIFTLLAMLQPGFWKRSNW